MIYQYDKTCITYDDVLPLEPPKIELTMNRTQFRRLEEVRGHLTHELVVVVNLKAHSMAEPRHN